MNKIRIYLRNGKSFEVPATAEASQRRMNGHRIERIEPVGGKGQAVIEAEKEAAIAKMIAKKEAEIEARLNPEKKEPKQTGELTMSATKKQITDALTASGIKFNPNHRKQDLFNLYVSSRIN